jgi:uridylate kinase
MNIIKYGGSKVSIGREEYDDHFIQGLIDLVKKYSEQKFMIAIGGGALNKIMNEEAREKNPEITGEELDWVGIKSTWVNAEYVIKKFKEAKLDVCSEVIKDPTKKVEGHRIYIAGAWKPGNSTDYVTMMLAKVYAAERVIKISDFEIVKDFSPLKVKDLSKTERDNILAEAKDLPNATWQKMIDLVGTEWVPRLNTPLDPLAAKLGFENKNITLYICKESELDKVLFGNLETFRGTIVSG